MKIDSVEFVMSAGTAPECPPGARAEIAMSGRSNVGKSSLLNSLFRRKGLAMVSNTPGKTQRLNYFLVNDRFHVVDLPGYGYAQASGAARNRWGQMMQDYLRGRQQLVAVIQLVDSRHALQPAVDRRRRAAHHRVHHPDQPDHDDRDGDRVDARRRDEKSRVSLESR